MRALHPSSLPGSNQSLLEPARNSLGLSHGSRVILCHRTTQVPVETVVLAPHCLLFHLPLCYFRAGWLTGFVSKTGLMLLKIYDSALLS